MAMSAAHLSAALKTSLLTRGWVANNAALTELCDSLAGAIVAEVQLATITVPITAVALQTSTAPGSPTAAPPAPIPINGAIS